MKSCFDALPNDFGWFLLFLTLVNVWLLAVVITLSARLLRHKNREGCQKKKKVVHEIGQALGDLFNSVTSNQRKISASKVMIFFFE